MKAIRPRVVGDVRVDPTSDRRGWGILVGVDQRKSLWTVPPAWKSLRTRFPPRLGRRSERAAHNGPQGVVIGLPKSTKDVR